METGSEGTNMDNKTRHSLSPLSAWALAFGCVIGWGSFVMPGTTFLPTAGPAGTGIAMAVGAALMLVIGFNFHFMMNRCSEAGGAYAYAKGAFGRDHAFLCAWFLGLSYIALIPQLIPVSTLAPESYLMLALWSILGFMLYWRTLKTQLEENSDKSLRTGLVLLLLVIFSSLLWVRQTSQQTTEQVLKNLNHYNETELAWHGIELAETENADAASQSPTGK